MADRPDIDLVSGDFWGRNPHDEMTWMRHNEPVYFDEKNGIWAITKYDHVKEASTNPKLFSSAGGIRPETGPVAMMIDMDDPGHVRRRKLVNRGFTPNRVKEQEAFLQHISDELIDQVAERGECDFVWDVAAWLPLIVIGNALGFAPESYPELLKWSDAMLSALGHGDPERMEEVTAAFTGYTTYIMGVIADRRENPRDDMISTLIHAEVDGDRLDDDNLIHESLLLLIGGDETTRHVFTGGLYQLLRDREQWERLRADRSLLAPAIEEMLRWVSPIKNMARTVTKDVSWHGASLKEGQKVLLLYPSANRDEDVFDDPFRFDITRTPNEHVAFGFGTHFCLGNSLARLELRVLMDRLLDRLPDIRLVDEAEPAFRPANFVSDEGMKVAYSPVAKVGAPPDRRAGEPKRYSHPVRASEKNLPDTTADVFAGSSVLVTGGGTGIGKACAAWLAANGAAVTICGRTEATLSAAAEEIGKVAAGGGSVRFSIADTTSEDDVVRVVAETAEHGPLLGCVANAGGGGGMAPYGKLETSEFIRVLHVNALSTFLCLKHSLPKMIERGGGSFVAISSIAGQITHPFFGAYGPGKAALEETVRNAADEYGSTGVRCNAVRPGFISTEIMSHIPRDSSIYDSYIENTPLGCVGEPEDVAELVGFLLSAKSRWITGQVFNVDGGHSLRRGPDFSEFAPPLL